MSIWANQSEDNQELVIKIRGRFDFSTHQEFRDAYEKIKVEPSRYTIDLNEVNYLDSSALGMLLLLRDHAGGDEADIRIINCSQDVRKILTISNFEQLFTIQ